MRFCGPRLDSHTGHMDNVFRITSSLTADDGSGAIDYESASRSVDSRNLQGGNVGSDISLDSTN